MFLGNHRLSGSCDQHRRAGGEWRSVEVKTLLKAVETLVDATQVLRSESCGAEGQTYSLF